MAANAPKSGKIQFLPLDELAKRLRQIIAPTRHGFLKPHENCFTSKAVVQALMNHNFAASNADSIALANKLLEKGHFVHVDAALDIRFNDLDALFRFNVRKNV
jgi:hypothetical protein